MTVFEPELKKLGLSEKETSVYLTLLAEGPCSVRKLAQISGVNRGSVYDALKSLKQQGLVTFYHQDTKQTFVAEDPSKLKQLVGQQQEELERLANNLTDIIPELRSLHDAGGTKPVVRYYEGPQGVKTVLEDVLETMSNQNDKTYFVYSSASVREAGLYAAFPNYTTERIDKGITVHTISLGPGGSTVGLDKRKWIKAEEGAPTYILIYGGKVANISLGPKGDLIGVLIENPGLYQTQKLLFEHQWRSIA